MGGRTVFQGLWRASRAMLNVEGSAFPMGFDLTCGPCCARSCWVYTRERAGLCHTDPLQLWGCPPWEPPNKCAFVRNLRPPSPRWKPLQKSSPRSTEVQNRRPKSAAIFRFGPCGPKEELDFRADPLTDIMLKDNLFVPAVNSFFAPEILSGHGAELPAQRLVRLLPGALLVRCLLECHFTWLDFLVCFG
jgi:hypothetical protein